MTPEETELRTVRDEVAALEIQLAEAEEELVNGRAEHVRFRDRYLRVVAPLKARVDELEARLAEQAASRSPEDMEAARVAREAGARSARSERVADPAQPGPASSPPPTDEMRALYRRVARLTHPDLANNDEDRERRTRLMSRANEAYSAGDAGLLAQIELESTGSAPLGAAVGDQLVAAIRQRAAARSRLRAVESEMMVLTSDALSELARRVDEAARRGRDLLAEITAELQRRVDSLQAELASVCEEY